MNNIIEINDIENNIFISENIDILLYNNIYVSNNVSNDKSIKELENILFIYKDKVSHINITKRI